MPSEGWRDYFPTSVEEITSPEKALARWAKRPWKRRPTFAPVAETALPSFSGTSRIRPSSSGPRQESSPR